METTATCASSFGLGGRAAGGPGRNRSVAERHRRPGVSAGSVGLNGLHRSEDGLQIGWKRRFDVDPRSRDRVVEREPGRVQELAAQAGLRRRRRPGRRRRAGRSPPGARGSGASGPSPGCTRRSAWAASSSTTSKCVTASFGESVSSERRVGSRRSRPIGASIRPLRERGRPRTSARYSRSSPRRFTSARRPSYASSLFETTISPDVSRSRRWTIPGRSGSPPARPGIPCASVPVAWPAPGCTTSPAGLSTTARCSSS